MSRITQENPNPIRSLLDEQVYKKPTAIIPICEDQLFINVVSLMSVATAEQGHSAKFLDELAEIDQIINNIRKLVGDKP